jgi:hypothetical protein
MQGKKEINWNLLGSIENVISDAKLSLLKNPSDKEAWKKMATGFEGLQKFESTNPIKNVKADSYAHALLLQKVIEHKLSKDGYQKDEIKKVIDLQKNKEDFVSPAHKNDFRAAEKDKQKVDFSYVENLEVSVTRSLKDKNRFEVAVYETGEGGKKTLVSYDDINIAEGKNQNIVFRNMVGEKYKLDLKPSENGISMQIYGARATNQIQGKTYSAGSDGYVQLIENAANKDFPALPEAKPKSKGLGPDENVRILQQELNKLGLASTKPPLGALLIEDGKYGSKTQMALAEFIAKVQMTDAYKGMCEIDYSGSKKCDAPDLLPGPSLKKAMEQLLKPGMFKHGDYRFENIIPAMKNLGMLNSDQSDDLYGFDQQEKIEAIRRAQSPQNTFVPSIPPASKLIGIPPIPTNIPVSTLPPPN